MKIILIVLLTSFAFSAQAHETSKGNADDNINATGYHRVTPCSAWRYSSEARGKVCNFTAGSFEAADRSEINRLERRIDQLEIRLMEMTELLQK